MHCLCLLFYLHFPETTYFLDCPEYYVVEADDAKVDVIVHRDGDITGSAVISKFVLVLNCEPILLYHDKRTQLFSVVQSVIRGQELIEHTVGSPK